MSDVRAELARSAAGLEAASSAAMTSLGLAPGEFAWFTGQTQHPMAPQKLIPDLLIPGTDIEIPESDHVTSRVTFYGGRAANELGNFVCGHIQANIEESIPEDALHQAGRNQMPKPFIPRLLTVKDGIITVDTPTRTPALNGEPVVIEGMGRDPRFRRTTQYNVQTGTITVRSGEMITDGHGWIDDRTVETDAFELPDDILLPRLATVVRTIKTVSAMFDQIAWRNTRDVTWQITERSPF